MLRLIVIFASFVFFVQTKDLPKYLQPYKCPSGENFETCFIESGNAAIPLVAKGDPEYHIPKLNPMEIPFLQLISTPTLSLNLTNIKISGLDTLKLVSIRFFWEQGMYTTIFNGQSILIEGNYMTEGRVMVMPVTGNGQFTLDLRNATFKVTAVSKIYQKNGEDYYKPSEFRLDYQFENMHFNFQNLFGGDKQLGDQVNKFLNENWDILVVDFGPGIIDTVSGVIKNIYEQFAAEVPLKYYFKE